MLEKNVPTFGIRKFEYIFFIFHFINLFFSRHGHECQHISEKIKLDEMKMKKKYDIYQSESLDNFIQNKLLISEECGNDWQIEI